MFFCRLTLTYVLRFRSLLIFLHFPLSNCNSYGRYLGLKGERTIVRTTLIEMKKGTHGPVYEGTRILFEGKYVFNQIYLKTTKNGFLEN